MSVVPSIRVRKPTDKDWVPSHLLCHILEMRHAAINERGYAGSYILILARSWEVYLPRPYGGWGLPFKSIQDRILEIEGMLDISISRTLLDYDMVLAEVVADGETK